MKPQNSSQKIRNPRKFENFRELKIRDFCAFGSSKSRDFDSCQKSKISEARKPNNKQGFLGNKKGGEKYLSIWWFLVLIVIGAGIVIGVSIFNVRDINIKKVESSILLSRVVNCIVGNGYLKDEVLAGNFDLGNCSLNKDIINNSGKYYLAFEIYKFEDCSLQGKVECKNPVVSKSFGVLDFQNQCKISEKTNARYYPECEEKYVYTLGNGKMVLHITAGSNQIGKVEAAI